MLPRCWHNCAAAAAAALYDSLGALFVLTGVTYSRSVARSANRRRYRQIDDTCASEYMDTTTVIYFERSAWLIALVG